MKIKNKTIRIFADQYGKLSLTVYDKDKKGVLSHYRTFKFDGHMEGVDVEINVPPRCRSEYAKIIKVK